MLTLLSIFLLLSAAVSAYFYLYRRENSELALSTDRDVSHLRPLFMPSEADLRADELETQTYLNEIEAAKVAAEEDHIKVDFQGRLDRWRAAPSNEAIADLLSSIHNHGTLLADAAECICEEWDNGRVDLSGNDLAQLIESHFWLIPAEKRTPGVSYRIQRLLSSLRSGDGNTLQTHDSLR